MNRHMKTGWMLFVGLCLVLACGTLGPSAEAVGDEGPADSREPAPMAPCGQVDLSLPDDMPLDSPPQMTRDRWLAESLSTADAVVWARGDRRQWRIDDVLCGSLPPEVPRLALGNEASELGVRFLVQTNRGYFDVGPVARPATGREWAALRRRARPREPVELEVEDDDDGVTRYAQVGGQRVQYGVAAAAGSDYVNVTLADGRDVATAVRVFGRRGRFLAWERRPAEGRGFVMRWWDDGSIRDWDHYLAGRAHGVHRSHFENGQIEREVTFRDGVRHGIRRLFEEDGSLISEQTFEQGLVPPITRPRTGPTAARLHTNEWTYYTAPAELLERLTVGMTVQQVADRLGLPVSAALGVETLGEACGTSGLHIRFREGRVSERERTTPLGGCDGI